MNADPIYVDARDAAVLRHGGISTVYLTIEEAERAWRELPPHEKPRATITVSTGTKYDSAEIERFHYGPKPA